MRLLGGERSLKPNSVTLSIIVPKTLMFICTFNSPNSRTEVESSKAGNVWRIIVRGGDSRGNRSSICMNKYDTKSDRSHYTILSLHVMVLQNLRLNIPKCNCRWSLKFRLITPAPQEVHLLPKFMLFSAIPHSLPPLFAHSVITHPMLLSYWLSPGAGHLKWGSPQGFSAPLAQS